MKFQTVKLDLDYMNKWWIPVWNKYIQCILNALVIMGLHKYNRTTLVELLFLLKLTILASPILLCNGIFVALLCVGFLNFLLV